MPPEDSVSELPWVESLGRHMRPGEARLFWKYAKLDPSQAVKWISEHIGPYDAGRAVRTDARWRTYLRGAPTGCLAARFGSARPDRRLANESSQIHRPGTAESAGHHHV